MWGAREETISMTMISQMEQVNGNVLVMVRYKEKQWGTANSSNNLCPMVYRIPTTDEFQV